jgi:hypothetical protein
MRFLELALASEFPSSCWHVLLSLSLSLIHVTSFVLMHVNLFMNTLQILPDSAPAPSPSTSSLMSFFQLSKLFFRSWLSLMRFRIAVLRGHATNDVWIFFYRQIFSVARSREHNEPCVEPPSRIFFNLSFDFCFGHHHWHRILPLMRLRIAVSRKHASIHFKDMCCCYPSRCLGLLLQTKLLSIAHSWQHNEPHVEPLSWVFFTLSFGLSDSLYWNSNSYIYVAPASLPCCWVGPEIHDWVGPKLLHDHMNECIIKSRIFFKMLVSTKLMDACITSF